MRELRARLLLLLLAMRCPPGSRPARRWYVQGGVARLGVEGIRRAWRGFHGEEPPCERRLRGHLGVLERSLALVRVPGDWMPGRYAGPRPRYPDTLLVLTSEAEVSWWAQQGLERLDAHPGARVNPTTWREVFGDWRRELHQPRLPFPASEPRRGTPTSSPAAPPARPAALQLARAVRDAQDAVEPLRALAAAGARLSGPLGWRLAADPRLACGLAALLARALWRGDGIRSRTAWVAAAARHPNAHELAQAEAWARRAAAQTPEPQESAS